jgi:hypothetical protein
VTIETILFDMQVKRLKEVVKSMEAHTAAPDERAKNATEMSTLTANNSALKRAHAALNLDDVSTSLMILELLKACDSVPLCLC